MMMMMMMLRPALFLRFSIYLYFLPDKENCSDVVVYDSYTLLRVPLGDFDFSSLASSYREPGIAFCLLYSVFLVLALLNLFIIVMFHCFLSARRQEARRHNSFYLQDLLNKVSRPCWLRVYAINFSTLQLTCALVANAKR